MISLSNKFFKAGLLLCLIFFLYSCDSDGSNNRFLTDAEPRPYLPEGFTPVALYKSDVDIDEETIGGITYVTKEIYCYYLCEEKIIVASYTTIYINKNTGALDDSKTEQEPMLKGTYRLEGTTTLGYIYATTTHMWEDGRWEEAHGTESGVPISNGTFLVDDRKFTLYDIE